jgi:hypothetical protein
MVPLFLGKYLPNYVLMIDFASQCCEPTESGDESGSENGQQKGKCHVQQ